MRAAGVDLGKTGCRVRVGGGTRVGAGAPGLAEPGGAAAAAAAVLALLDPAPHLAVCVGAAGATAAPAAAAELAARLAAGLGTGRVAVTSDALTGHAGALAGGPGAVLAVGTGAVATAVTADGRVALVDGWGQWLGDEGGGAWLGREGLRRVLHARDGRGAPTALTAAAETRFGDLTALPAVLAAGGNPARASAAFAPDVLAAAAAGDPAALAVRDAAARALARTADAALAAAGGGPLAVLGGLAGCDALLARLPPRVRPRGTALDGALLLACRTDLPHEPHVHRHREPS